MPGVYFDTLKIRGPYKIQQPSLPLIQLILSITSECKLLDKKWIVCVLFKLFAELREAKSTHDK